jgi:hypothetical protein
MQRHADSIHVVIDVGGGKNDGDMGGAANQELRATRIAGQTRPD